MTLAAQITSDLSVFFNADEFAKTITYNGSSISAIVDYDENLSQGDRSAKADSILVVKVSDVPSPAYRDTVVIGSATWRVLNIAEGDGYTWTLNLYRDERPRI